MKSITEVAELYRIQIQKMADEDGGGFVAFFPTLGLETLNGVGETVSEANQNLMDNGDFVLQFMHDHNVKLPSPTREDFDWFAGQPCIANTNFAYAA